MKREEIAARVRAAARELRPEARVIDIGTTHALSRGTVELQCLVEDSGLLMVLWRLERAAGAGPNAGFTVGVRRGREFPGGGWGATTPEGTRS